MKTSEQIDKLAEALAAAQGEFSAPDRNREVVVKTKAGGEYRFRYSTLDCVMDMARPVLSKHGLSITQPPTVRESSVVVLTRLMHSSGQWQEEEIIVTPETLGPQEIGSAITYLKRYAYTGMLGIASEEDDDGNHASGNQVSDSRERPKLGACPKCGKASSVIAGKAEHGGGIVCWKKKEGCGHTWATDAHPFSEKHGEGNVPSNQSNGAKPEKPQAQPERCKEFIALGKFLQNCRPNLSHEVTPEEATRIINWAVPGVGEIAGLRMMGGECQQIFDALEGTGMSGPQIYAEAVEATAVI